MHKTVSSQRAFFSFTNELNVNISVLFRINTLRKGIEAPYTLNYGLRSIIGILLQV